MKLLFVVLLCYAWSASVAAQWLPAEGACNSGQCLPQRPPLPAARAPQTPSGLQVDPRAIVRVANELAGSRALGTGTLVDVDSQQGVVITCAHLFREGVGRLVVTLSSGRAFQGRLLKMDAAADLAAVAIAPPAVAPIEVSRRSPERGEPLVSCGLGSDGQLWCNRGTALGYVTVTGSHGTETLELSGSARQGDSGGPVLDRHHQLVAVIFGTNGQVVDGTFCGRVRGFLAEACPRFRPRPAPITPPRVSPPGDLMPQHEAEPPLTPIPQVAGPVAPREQCPPSKRPEASPSSEVENDATEEGASASSNGAIDRGADAVEAITRPWLSAKLTALLISLGVPGGVAGVVAAAVVWLVMRRGKKRLQARLDRLERGALLATTDVASDLEPAIVERHHNQFVPYEVTSHDKAWSAAHAHVGERYPGAVPYLKLVEGVKDQLLSGEKNPQLS